MGTPLKPDRRSVVQIALDHARGILRSFGMIPADDLIADVAQSILLECVEMGDDLSFVDRISRCSRNVARRAVAKLPIVPIAAHARSAAADGRFTEAAVAAKRYALHSSFVEPALVVDLETAIDLLRDHWGSRVKRPNVKTTALDLTNRRFGNVVVLEVVGRANQKLLWKYGCDCGNSGNARSSDLVNGRIRSCGCQRTARIRAIGASGDGARASNVARRAREAERAIIWATGEEAR